MIGSIMTIDGQPYAVNAGNVRPFPSTGKKRIDLAKSTEVRNQFSEMLCRCDSEAARLRELAKSGPARYYATRMSQAKHQDEDAKYFRERIAEIDRLTGGRE